MKNSRTSSTAESSFLATTVNGEDRRRVLQAVVYGSLNICSAARSQRAISEEEERGVCIGARQRGHVGSLIATEEEEEEDQEATHVLRQREPKTWLQGRESGVSTLFLWVLLVVVVDEKGSRQMVQARCASEREERGIEGRAERYRSREGRICGSIGGFFLSFPFLIFLGREMDGRLEIG